MKQKTWKINDINPGDDMWFADIERDILISLGTLNNWRKSGRLRVYDNPRLTKGIWLINAIRGMGGAN